MALLPFLHGHGSMGARTLNLLIVGIWLASMGWLISVKILPTLRHGNQPKYDASLAGLVGQVDTGWQIQSRGQGVGWAINRVIRDSSGAVTVRNHVRLEALPVRELTFGFLGSLLPADSKGTINAQVATEIYAAPDGRLDRFNSRIRLAEFEDLICLDGKATDTALELNAHCGNLNIPSSVRIGENIYLTDQLSPVGKMPDLKLGQTWSQPIISPLRPPNAPAEIMLASVERTDILAWNNGLRHVLVVAYRSATAGRAAALEEPIAQVWVAEDGTVLKHSLQLGSLELVFLRVSDDDSTRMAIREFSGANISSLQPNQADPNLLPTAVPQENGSIEPSQQFNQVEPPGDPDTWQTEPGT